MYWKTFFALVVALTLALFLDGDRARADFVKIDVNECQYSCNICNFYYLDEMGDPENNVPPGTKFQNLPLDYICPSCGQTLYGFLLAGSSYYHENTCKSFHTGYHYNVEPIGVGVVETTTLESKCQFSSTGSLGPWEDLSEGSICTSRPSDEYEEPDNEHPAYRSVVDFNYNNMECDGECPPGQAPLFRMDISYPTVTTIMQVIIPDPELPTGYLYGDPDYFMNFRCTVCECHAGGWDPPYCDDTP